MGVSQACRAETSAEGATVADDAPSSPANERRNTGLLPRGTGVTRRPRSVGRLLDAGTARCAWRTRAPPNRSAAEATTTDAACRWAAEEPG